MFCIGIEEIDESQIGEIGEFSPEVEMEDFSNLDDFVEPKTSTKRKKVTTLTLETEDSLLTGESEWSTFGMSDSLIGRLEMNGYVNPTEIQSKTLNTSLSGKDLIAAAETGSGKTLAYGIPVINELMKHDPEGVEALILVPTRELAKQVVEHLRKISELNIVGVYGGISVEKQKRQLKKSQILIATPGRLWDLLEKEDLELSKVKFLVVDEADKMLEPHHFKQLDMILEKVNPDRQTLVFSATILPGANLQQFQPNKGKSMNLFSQLLKRINFRDREPLYLNLSSSQIVAQGVMESQIKCLNADKVLLINQDLMIYYLVTKYTGKTIVFVNSIHAIRRLIPILSCLKQNIFGLHAEMQQKQRLKNFERFTQSNDSVLIASDIAARGLDIPAVDMVIHYQVPRSGEIYVHRSGRTGRLHSKGISIVLTAPGDEKAVQKLCTALNRTELAPFPVDNALTSYLKKPLKIAIEIDQLEHSNRKQKSEKDWFQKAAESADLPYSDQESDEDAEQTSKNFKVKLCNLKQQLQDYVVKTPSSKPTTALEDLQLAHERGFMPVNHVSAKKRKMELKNNKQSQGTRLKKKQK